MALKIRRNTSPAPPHGCPLTHCLSVFGGAWAPNVIWNLSGGPRRFGELKRDIPGISSKMLATRLKELCEKGILERRVQDTSPPSVEYTLTELGGELVPALEAIVRVGHRLKERAGEATCTSGAGKDGDGKDEAGMDKAGAA